MGERYELEATTAMARGFNDALLEEILSRSPEQPSRTRAEEQRHATDVC
jgi:hypothetical protein